MKTPFVSGWQPRRLLQAALKKLRFAATEVAGSNPEDWVEAQVELCRVLEEVAVMLGERGETPATEFEPNVRRSDPVSELRECEKRVRSLENEKVSLERLRDELAGKLKESQAECLDVRVELARVNDFRADLRAKFQQKADQLSVALCHFEAVKRERDQALADAAVMREALGKLSRLGNEPLVGNSIGNQIAAQALASTDAGTDLLERAEELCRLATMLCNQAAVLATHCDALGPMDGNFSASRAFIRTDIDLTRKAVNAFLEGEGVKA
jgi:hypothetical protein